MLPEAGHKSCTTGYIKVCAAKSRHELAQAFKAKSFAQRMSSVFGHFAGDAYALPAKGAQHSPELFHVIQGPPYLARVVWQVVDKLPPLFFSFSHAQGMAPCGIIFAAYTRITLWGRGFCRRFGKFWLIVVGLCRVNEPIGHGASPLFGRHARIC